LERQLGIPVLCSVSATLWKALDVAGAPATIPGWGQLLASGTPRAGGGISALA
jgi:maleate isomerase